MSNDSALPSPLVPGNVDLRDFPYMPMEIARLFGSEFHARANDAAWRAGVTLWLKSFHQVPAASLPADDLALARLAEFGRDTKAWGKVKGVALRGWLKTSDGRLYHRVVAVKALEAWVGKLTQRRLSEAGNAQRHKLPFDPGPVDLEIDRAVDLLSKLDPQSRALRRRSPAGRPGGRPADALTGVPPGSQEKGREEKVHPSQVQNRSQKDGRKEGDRTPCTILAVVGGTAAWDEDAPFAEAAS
jgi:hypothetical protein